MKHKSIFVVLTKRSESLLDSKYPHYEKAYTAQEAVDKVRGYLPDTSKIVAVFKQVENWK